MKNILVRFYDPRKVMDYDPEVLEEDIIDYCFRVNKYPNEAFALDAYANTPCTWSTLLDETQDIDEFIYNAWYHIKIGDTEWLEEHFV